MAAPYRACIIYGCGLSALRFARSAHHLMAAPYRACIRSAHHLMAAPYRACIRSAHLLMAAPYRACIRSAHGSMQYNAPGMQIGKHSRKLVELRKAIRQGVLTRDGLLPIEGPILLEEAARSEIEIVDVFRRTGAEVPPVLPDAMYDIPAEIFKSLHDTEQSQGIIATVRPRQYTLGDAFAGAPQLLVVLGRLQDPGNVGTILRIGES